MHATSNTKLLETTSTFATSLLNVTILFQIMTSPVYISSEASTPGSATISDHPTPTMTPKSPGTPATLNNEPGLFASNTYSDREERAVAALLTRFKALVTLAAEPVREGATKEVAAAQALQMEVESSALVSLSTLYYGYICRADRS